MVSIVQSIRDSAYGFRYIKSDMLKSLTDEVIDASCDRFDAVPDGCSEFRMKSTSSKLTFQLGFSNTQAAAPRSTSRILASLHHIARVNSQLQPSINGVITRRLSKTSDASRLPRNGSAKSFIPILRADLYLV